MSTQLFGPNAVDTSKSITGSTLGDYPLESNSVALVRVLALIASQKGSATDDWPVFTAEVFVRHTDTKDPAESWHEYLLKRLVPGGYLRALEGRQFEVRLKFIALFQDNLKP